jgi:hypothetical protein
MHLNRNLKRDFLFDIKLFNLILILKMFLINFYIFINKSLFKIINNIM